jgi:hypothetical protein
VRRKRTGADELLEQLDHFRLAGDFSDRPFVIFGHERRGFFAGEFFVFFVEFGVTVDFAERLLQDFYLIPRRTRRQDKGRAGKPEKHAEAARACASTQGWTYSLPRSMEELNSLKIRRVKRIAAIKLRR